MHFNLLALFSVVSFISFLTLCSGKPAGDNGYGRYIHMVLPYVHTSDFRELGKYHHIHNPYGGGYGPYAGLHNPYSHDGSGNYDHNLYTSTTQKPTTTRATTTTTTTTTTPRSILFKYDDEGRHKILRQEEDKNKKKYDFLYLTENGIYGEEQAHLHDGGTHAKGYYEYTGDDGKLYRVNYQSDHNGFKAVADHIPTPPPIPDAIHKALKYVADKRLNNNDMPNFDHKGFRLGNMPTIDRPIQQEA